MEHVKAHFEEEAAVYDGLIRRIIPGYDEMIDALVSALPFEATQPIRVLDLGCGTGNIAAAVKARFPHATVHCVDFAERMIAVAQAKLAAHDGITFQLDEFSVMTLDQRFDAAVSSLALHHLVTGDDKRVVYRRVHDALDAGGAFFNADHVLGPSPELQAMYLRQWKAFMARHMTVEEIEGTWIPVYEREDHPVPVIEQLRWLSEIGFAPVEVVWKWHNFAVYGGLKPK